MVPDLSQPETWGLVSLLIFLLFLFLRGDIVPGRTHDRIVAQIKEDHAKAVVQWQEECSLWRQIALRGVELSESSLDVIKRVKK
jgi:hypothetical protein